MDEKLMLLLFILIGFAVGITRLIVAAGSMSDRESFEDALTFGVLWPLMAVIVLIRISNRGIAMLMREFY